jgi:hypothetical protein
MGQAVPDIVVPEEYKFQYEKAQRAGDNPDG